MINVFIGYEQGQDFNSKCAHSFDECTYSICYSWAKSRYFVGSKNTYIYQETNDRNALLFLSWCTSSVFIKVQPPTLVFQCFTIYLFPAQAAGFSSS